MNLTLWSNNQYETLTRDPSDDDGKGFRKSQLRTCAVPEEEPSSHSENVGVKYPKNANHCVIETRYNTNPQMDPSIPDSISARMQVQVERLAISSSTRHAELVNETVSDTSTAHEMLIWLKGNVSHDQQEHIKLLIIDGLRAALVENDFDDAVEIQITHSGNKNGAVCLRLSATPKGECTTEQWQTMRVAMMAWDLTNIENIASARFPDGVIEDMNPHRVVWWANIPKADLLSGLLKFLELANRAKGVLFVTHSQGDAYVALRCPNEEVAIEITGERGVPSNPLKHSQGFSYPSRLNGGENNLVIGLADNLLPGQPLQSMSMEPILLRLRRFLCGIRLPEALAISVMYSGSTFPCSLIRAMWKSETDTMKVFNILQRPKSSADCPGGLIAFRNAVLFSFTLLAALTVVRSLKPPNGTITNTVPNSKRVSRSQLHHRALQNQRRGTRCAWSLRQVVQCGWTHPQSPPLARVLRTALVRSAVTPNNMAMWGFIILSAWVIIICADIEHLSHLAGKTQSKNHQRIHSNFYIIRAIIALYVVILVSESLYQYLLPWSLIFLRKSNILFGMWLLHRKVLHSRVLCTVLILATLVGCANAIGELAVATATTNQALSDIVFLTLNVSSGLRKKDDLLRAYIKERKPDFLVVTETGLTETDITKDDHWVDTAVPGYTGHHITPPANVPQGERTRKGVSLFVRQVWEPYIEQKKPSLVPELNLIYIRIKEQAQNQPLHIVGMYAEPNHGLDKERYWAAAMRWLKAENLLQPRTKLVIIGDLNVAPNATLDRFRDANEPHGYDNGGIKSFKALLDKGNLFDVWRDTHPGKIQFSWFKHEQRARLDFALVSGRLVDKVHYCEILDSRKPLTKDHVPFELHLACPNRLQQVPSPDIEIPQLNETRLRVKKFGDDLINNEYKTLVINRMAARGPDMTMNLSIQERYSDFTTLLYDVADKVLGTRQRTFNKPRATREPSKLEKYASVSADVLLSKHTIIKRLENGERFGSTHNIDKLLGLAPDTLSSPSEISSKEEALKWFSKLQSLHNEWDREASTAFEDTRLEAMLENLARAVDQESSGPRSWYGKVRALFTTNKSKRKQMAAIEEIDPETLGTYKQGEIPVTDTIRRFWADLFSRRSSAPVEQRPWFSEKFKARRVAVLEASRDLVKPFTTKELRAALQALQNEKASGIDGIPGEILKHMPEEAREELLCIFNDILRTRQFPDQWRETRIYTLHKGGDGSKCSNYRPISLLPVPYKLFMSILTKRLSLFAEERGLLSNCQGGFRRGRSCIDKISLVTAKLEDNRKLQLKSHLGFIDIKKAYDSVPQDLLLETLAQHQLHPEFTTLLETLYANNKAVVVTVYGDTQPFPLERGVKQGCPMSPILFNLFLEPLLEWLVDSDDDKENIYAAYADDIAIITTENRTLQNAMSKVDDFLYANRLELGIGTDKSVYMTDAPDGQIAVSKVISVRSENHIHLQKTNEKVLLPRLTGHETYKYLGVHLNVVLNWDKHLQISENKLRRHLYCLKNKHYSRRQTVKICNTVIIPYLTYGLECMTVPIKKLSFWTNSINHLVNNKGGLIRNAEADLNYIPLESLGEGLESLTDRIERLQITGRLKHGLNSIDTDTARLCLKNVNRYHNRQIPLPDVPCYGRKTAENVIRIVRNKAHEYGKDVLERLFENNVCNALRQQRNVTTVADLITDTGQITDLASDLNLTIGGTRHVNPIILHGINHRKALEGIQCDHPTTDTLRVWTDASKSVSGQAGYAVWFGEANALNHQHRLPDKSQVFAAELQAAILALLLHDPRLKLEIYSDNQAVVNLLHNRNFNTRNHELEAEWIVAAKNVLTQRDKSHLSTRFIHVYSHLLDKSESHLSDTERERLQKMKNQFGNEWRTILYGNQQVDKAAARAASQPHPIVAYEFPNMPRFLVRRPGTVGSFTSASTILKEQRASDHHEKLIKNKQRKYTWLNKENVDWHRSAYLGHDRRRSSDALQRHASKSRRQLFSVKTTRLDAQEKNIAWKLHSYHGVRVQDDICDLCRSIEPTPQREDKFHYLRCAAHKERRQQMTRDIHERVQNDAVNHIDQLPCYWNEEDKHTNAPSDDWKQIESFSANDAAMAIIPHAWVTHLKNINRKSGTNFEALIADCQIILIQGFYDCWKARCSKFHALHPPQQDDENRPARNPD